MPQINTSRKTLQFSGKILINSIVEPAHMGMEYKIEWQVPEGYNPSSVLQKLPSPIGKGMQEIYNYSVESDGFYFLDHLVDKRIAGEAMKLLVDEGLNFSDEVIIRGL